jgi:hypothetical protein
MPPVSESPRETRSQLAPVLLVSTARRWLECQGLLDRRITGEACAVDCRVWTSADDTDTTGLTEDTG